MNAFHSFWSVPNTCRNHGEIGFPDYELLTAILSALTWKMHSGTIKMITDSKGAAFFEQSGLGNLWDEMDTSLDGIDRKVDPFLFWAAGKLFALKQMETPCVMLDTDLIVWKHPEFPEDVDVCAAHYEDLNPFVYPDPKGFKRKPGYVYPENWDFSLKAANTAFLYLKNADFRDYYVEEAIRFFNHIEMDGLNPVSAMCFAEQRVLPMCAVEKGQKLGFLLNPYDLNGQDLMTHTWGFKEILRRSPEAMQEYCMRLVKRIMKDYPEMEPVLAENRQLRKYYEEYQKAGK